MKTFVFIALLVVGFQAHADQVFSVRACSSYFRATEEDHARSAQRNFETKANNVCAGLGSLTWEAFDVETHSGFNVPVYCISGKIYCYQ